MDQAKKECMTLQRKYRTEMMKDHPNQQQLATYKEQYRRKRDYVECSTTMNIKLKTQHKIDNMADRLGNIIDNYRGKTSEEDRRIIKSLTNMQLKLAAIRTQYISEFERDSTSWSNGIEALYLTYQLVVGGDFRERRFENGIEVIEILSD